MTTSSPGSGHFESTHLRCVYGIPAAILGLLALSAATTGVGGIAFGVTVALVCCYLAVRAFRMGVSYSPEGIVVRGYVRTRKWPWSEVTSFEVNQGPVGAMAYRRKVLSVTLTSGQTQSFKDQNASLTRAGEASWIELAVADLNRELSERT